ncbi:heavy metal-associated isoprenylated plant protein 47 [Raphanus sativus]|uniref:Heavy metal-associated isoprenylated plant protein 47 n=1 Tax=Raphanus sativus TaxID=3726 RepID=A0A9W3DAW8_RAPSA|nr:heavy metal-associated isoprenylated plant protein 47 [Raphanus sativus]
MAKKILMSVNMRCQKCRSAALKIGGQTTGVTFVGLEGEEKDQVVVIGEGVDAAGLVLRLRKKVGFADLISVTDVDTS